MGRLPFTSILLIIGTALLVLRDSYPLLGLLIIAVTILGELATKEDEDI
jgi:hypothetical protein